MARYNSEKSVFELICPEMTVDINHPVYCKGSECGKFSDISVGDFRKRHVTGCAVVVANRLWKRDNW